MFTIKLEISLSTFSQVEHVLSKINSPNTRPRPDIQHAPGFINRSAIQRTPEEHLINMMAQIETILLLFIVWLGMSIKYPNPLSISKPTQTYSPS